MNGTERQAVFLQQRPPGRHHGMATASRGLCEGVGEPGLCPSAGIPLLRSQSPTPTPSHQGVLLLGFGMAALYPGL